MVNMNRNRKLNRKRFLSAAVGMSLLLGNVPVLAAEEPSKTVTKEETVYVTTDAEGRKKEVIVSNQLKNAGEEKSLEDHTELKDIKNVKGEETFQKKENTLVWDTDNTDIYYQGTTEKELPVSVKMKYLLDGKEISPEKLAGKNGHLQIQVSYENHEKKAIDVDGKEETFYSPFLLMTGMILPEETFSNIKIDNGKVISDGTKSIVIGMGMPGMKENLGTDMLEIPENFEISADIKDFSMGPAFTVAVADVLEALDTENVTDVDELKDAFEQLEDAAMELVDGTGKISEGTSTLKDNYSTFHEGIHQLGDGTEKLSEGTTQLETGVQSYVAGVEELNKGIQTYLGKDGMVNGKITEFVNGTEKLVDSTKAYAQGAFKLAQGSSVYIQGEEKLAQGAEQMRPLTSGLAEVKGGISQIYAVLDGKGTAKDDLKLAAETLAGGMHVLNQSLNTTDMNNMMKVVDTMISTGNELLQGAEQMSSSMEQQITVPVTELMKAGEQLKQELAAVVQYVSTIQTQAQTALDAAEQGMADQVNQQIQEKNQKINAARAAASQAQEGANAQLASARSILDAQIAATTDETAKAALVDARNALAGISVTMPSIEEITPVAKPEIQVTIPQFDAKELVATITTMKTTYDNIQKNVAVLAEKELPAMKGKLDSLSNMKESIQPIPFKQLQSSVQALSNGAQKLQKGITELSTNVAYMDQKTADLPSAGEGIQSLLDGFDTLGAYNQQLTEGAAQLAENTPYLLQGMDTMKEGSQEVVKGIDVLGKTLSTGSAQLASNNQALLNGAFGVKNGSQQLLTAGHALKDGSGLLMNGITQLHDGATTLQDGMGTYEKDGIRKMKDTVQEELVSVFDRLQILKSSDCSYDTFSGKTEDMKGNVKFVIQTEPIE